MNGNKNYIGHLIREKRISKGLTQEQLAELIGKNQQDINRYENNKISPTKDTWIKICKILDISLEDYFVDSDFSDLKSKLKDVSIDNYPEEKYFTELKKLINKYPDLIKELNLVKIIKKLNTLKKEEKKVYILLINSILKLK